MKITVDTNFLISATQWDYSVANKLLEKLLINNYEIFTTKEILDEFEEILKRDFKYNNEEVKRIVDVLLQFLILIEPIRKITIVLDDPDDNKIIECALESKSDYIVSYDNHLLKIKEYKGIKIVKPEDLIKII